MGHNEGSRERDVHNNKGLSKKDRDISNKKPSPTPTRTAETTTNKVQRSRRKEITKIRVELNDIETKRTI